MDRERSQRSGLKWWLVGWLGKGLVDLICGTIRISVVGLEKARAEIESRRFILTFWHSRIAVISYLYQRWGAAILVSNSKDGEIMAQILQRQGHEPIRGSTSRHAVRALARLIRALKQENRPGVIVPDGPRGPRFKVQPGVITLAQKTGYSIVPVTYSAKRVKVFQSWDRFIFPYPFTEGRVIFGRPMSTPSTLAAEEQDVYRVRLEEELNRITRAADCYYGHQID
ncbi:MAG: lysophospholipid acyltransferase family protein [Thermodesulfobacteriota bacterium]|nr:lysophospholipid acyltransferase family protein [Thermodesulfobacteriota bacterium]